MTRELADLAQRYDAAIFDPSVRRLYGGTDFYNVGDWSEGPGGPPGPSLQSPTL